MIATINIHSMVDVITNSSTEIFIFIREGGVETVYEILNEILKIADSDKKAEDLFDVSIDRPHWDSIAEDYQQQVADMIDSEEDLSDEERELHENDDNGYRYQMDVVVPFLRKHPEIVEKFVDDDVDGYGYFNRSAETRLIIKSKDEDKSTLDIFQKFMSLFGIEAQYNG